MKTLLHLQVNGETYDVYTAVYKTLLEVLREDLNLTGTKHGCELGECGTCAVLIDGQQEPGTHTLTMGRGGLAGGVYLLRMMAGGTQKVERMVITR